MQKRSAILMYCVDEKADNITETFGKEYESFLKSMADAIKFMNNLETKSIIEAFLTALNTGIIDGNDMMILAIRGFKEIGEELVTHGLL